MQYRFFILMNPKAEFYRAVFDLKDLPNDGLPEMAFIGRSNVGKSSLINALAQQKNLAHISSKPGKTQSLNYYRFPGNWYLVDSPGFGFAQRSKAEQEKWRKLMESYIEKREELTAVALLIDSRHQGISTDIMALEWLSDLAKPIIVILTKIDKTTQKDLAAHEKYLRSEFTGVKEVFRVSTISGAGVKELLRNLPML